HLYLTANASQPCPRCTATGTPQAPGTGTCDRGARVGLACTTANSAGLTKDCPPGGVDGSNPCVENTNCADGSKNLGPIPIPLSPLTTGQGTRTAPDGLFCPGQGSSQKGCFKLGTNCVYIEENGSPAGSLFPTDTAKPFTMAAIFCIPSTTSSLVNLASNLPGPGATALTGTLTLRQTASLPSTTTTTTVSTTTGTTAPTTSSTTATTTTSTTTT